MSNINMYLNCFTELILDKKIKNKPEYSEDEEYDEKNSITDSELSSNDDDDEINFKQNVCKKLMYYNTSD